jgi:hypothetical protein
MIALAPETEQRLKTVAARAGLSPDEYVNQVLEEHISHAEQERRENLIALLSAWNEEEIAESEAYDDAFYLHLDENRPAGAKLFPPELKGISW